MGAKAQARRVFISSGRGVGGDYKECYPEGMVFFGLVIIVILSAFLIIGTIELLVGKPSTSMLYTTWTIMVFTDGLLTVAMFLLVYSFIEYFKCEGEILFRRIEELKRRCGGEGQ